MSPQTVVRLFSLDGITYASIKFAPNLLTPDEIALCQSKARTANPGQFGEVKLEFTENFGRITGDMLAVLPLKKGVTIEALAGLIGEMLPERELILDKYTDPANPRLSEAMRIRNMLLL